MSSSSERDTRDFMTVDSFAQLPFIRPAPPSPPSSSKSSTSSSVALRLFGFELPQDYQTDGSSSSNNVGELSGDQCNDKNNDKKSSSSIINSTENVKNNSGDDSARKFECHYCCRNFPTSQALGGHQNAHKRERQHAKRVQFQTVLPPPPSSFHHHYSGDAISYTVGGGGLFNYRRYSSIPSTTIGRFSSSAAHTTSFESVPVGQYSSWNRSSNISGQRLIGGLGSVSQPIQGSPLPAGIWRVPMTVHGTSAAPSIASAAAAMRGSRYENISTAAASAVASAGLVLPSLAGNGVNNKFAGGSSSSSSSSASPRSFYESSRPAAAAGVKDGAMSLDLHL